jgi:uncharacterized protein (TIGR03435 family)
MLISFLLSLTLMQQSSAIAAKPLPKFEVASIKPSNDRVGVDMYILPGGHLKVKALSLRQLVEAAWEMHPSRVTGPSSMYYVGYDIDAIPPRNDLEGGGPKGSWLGKEIPQITLHRLKALIIERFNLKYHFEDRVASYYDLVLDRRNGSLVQRPFNMNFPLQCTENKVVSMGRPISELAYDLGVFYLRSEVQDKTGLQENYAYSFGFEPMDSASATSDRPLLIDALKETGLRLVPRKGPVRYLVIDSFTSASEN